MYSATLEADGQRLKLFSIKLPDRVCELVDDLFLSYSFLGEFRGFLDSFYFEFFCSLTDNNWSEIAGGAASKI